MTEFSLRVITPEQTIIDKKVTSVIAPGESGYLGILAHHAPLITILKEGKLTVKAGTAEEIYKISPGVLEVFKNQAIILVDAINEWQE